MDKKSRHDLRRTQRVEMEFLESLHQRCPQHIPLLEALGHLYTRVGRHEDGLKMDLELTRLKPTFSENWYNLACSYALTGHKDEAFQSLERAIELGYNEFDWMKRDKDLEALRDDPRFDVLLTRQKKKRT